VAETEGSALGSVRSLLALNCFLADVQTGLGPFLAAYLVASGWNPRVVGSAGIWAARCSGMAGWKLALRAARKDCRLEAGATRGVAELMIWWSVDFGGMRICCCSAGILPAGLMCDEEEDCRLGVWTLEKLSAGSRSEWGGVAVGRKKLPAGSWRHDAAGAHEAFAWALEFVVGREKTAGWKPALREAALRDRPTWCGGIVLLQDFHPWPVG
jgi:hypothetical protein